ncbi:hypothetical protein ACEQ8H_008083 [Pleosporales sp. CAS-2024a]
MTAISAQDDPIEDAAISLIRRTWQDCDSERGTGFMSCAVYDTAWISMVTKNIAGEKTWLFPQSFRYLISTQSEDGSWAVSTTSAPIDGILGTAASLLSLRAHYSEPLDTEAAVLDGIEERIYRATVSLNSQLSNWDVAATSHVGFEIIVPALLKLLRHDANSTILEFADEKVLAQINYAKMSRLNSSHLYGRASSSALHSLEAFIGILDFDKLAHHKVNGSMMGSPSSTAAYLIHVSNWDYEAEAYLCHVVRAGVGKGNGAVPSAFPSMFFEYTWMLSTMLRAGISLTKDCCPEMTAMVKLLRSAFDEGEGLIGFAPGLPVDVDDTAKCIISLNRLGEEASATAMIAAFEAETHFRTYASERNPSFTANCNVLSAILQQPDPSFYQPQITKLVQFLCDYLWESDGSVRDKWNSSCLYSSLLAIQVFGDIFIQVEKCSIEPIGPDLLSQMHIAMFQICLRTLLRDSKPESVEETAYRVLLLCEAKRFPLFDSLGHQIDADIQNQLDYLHEMANSRSDSDNSQVWIEKVSFGSQVLTQSYKIAAIKAASCPGSRIEAQYCRDIAIGTKASKAYIKMLMQTPLFADSPQWQVAASVLEASLFQPLLRRRRLDVFPRKDMAPDKYFDLIPLTWTSCNNRINTFASSKFIFEMMIISFLDFQADEFMEAVAGKLCQGRIGSLRNLVDDAFRSVETEIPNKPQDLSHGMDKIPKPRSAGEAYQELDLDRERNSTDQVEIQRPLTRFVNYISQHSSVQSASPWDRSSTLRELQIYLHAQVTQSEDNARLAKVRNHMQGVERDCAGEFPPPTSVADRSYFRWVRTTSGDHTACPYSFAFACCLLSAQLDGVVSIPTLQGKYMAAAACQHLATMCRMYNDYGSIARDRVECNLNSLDFDEFRSEADESRLESVSKQGHAAGLNDVARLKYAKETLFELAQYERSGLGDALCRLKQEMKRDLYGQIYVVKDIASPMTGHKILHHS